MKKIANQICIFEKTEYLICIVRFNARTDGLVAQSVEHRPFKAVVPGSNPGQLTIFFVFISRIYTMNRGRDVSFLRRVPQEVRFINEQRLQYLRQEEI